MLGEYQPRVALEQRLDKLIIELKRAEERQKEIQLTLSVSGRTSVA